MFKIFKYYKFQATKLWPKYSIFVKKIKGINKSYAMCALKVTIDFQVFSMKI